MSIDANGFPPVPGSDRENTEQRTAVRPDSMIDQIPQTQAQQAQDASYGFYGTGAENANAPHAPVSSRKPGVINAVAGAVAGAATSAALIFGLLHFGVIGGTPAAKTSSASTSQQAVNITPSSENTTIAQAVSAKALPSVVPVMVTTESGSGNGSGVILDNDGNIITNYHVIQDATAISVTIDGKTFVAKLVGSDSTSDLAVIHVDLGDTKVTPIEVGDSDHLSVGDWVMSVGSPFGLDQSVSSGIVSALTRNTMLSSSSGNTLYTNLIQVDAAINPGNSGGALVNSEGKLVGICTLYTSSTQSFAGIGFAIPGNYAVNVANKIIKGETVTHAYIGLSMQTVNAQNAIRNNFSVNQGAYVASVSEDSPAAKAGMQKGDIVTAVNGEAITSADSMILNVRTHSIGETVAVTYVRGSEEKTVNVTLGSDEQLQKENEEKKNRQNVIRDNGTIDLDNMNNTNDDINGDVSQNELMRYLQKLYGQRNVGSLE